MADPLKSDEIEDVLSSIRRLVSETHTAEDTSGETASEAEGSAVTAERLMLTPALRVTEPEDPWVPVAVNAPDSDKVDGTEDPDIADGANWASDLWGEPRSEDDAEPVSIDEQTDEQSDVTSLSEDVSVEAEIEALFVELDAQTDEPEAESTGLDENGDLISEVLENAYSEKSEGDEPSSDAHEDEEWTTAPVSFIRSTKSVSDYEPEEGNTDWPVEDPPVATRDLAEARGAVLDVHATQTEQGASDPSDAELHQDDGGSPAPEDMEHEGDQAPHDAFVAEDEATGEDVDDAASAVVDTSDNEVSTQDGPDVEDLGDEPFSFPDESDSFVDEEALRELISEVVREELQGELGVRITRNIRKLVRREIRIALAAEELE